MSNTCPIATTASIFEQALSDFLQQQPIASQQLSKARDYVTLNGGKRIRPLLVYGTGLACGLSVEQLHPTAIAVELIHCYSLVHDDLPAMDDDDLRRGKPSCHKAFNEATAILIGDGLQSLAMESLLRQHTFRPEVKTALIKTLLQAIGLNGMVAGQQLDLDAERQTALTMDALETIHRLKTGKLITTSVELALLASGKTPDASEFQALIEFSEIIGLVFQIQDDYLDSYGEISELGKPPGSDQRKQKQTYCNYYDKKGLEALIADHYQRACHLLAGIEGPVDLLQAIVTRLKARMS